MRKTVKLSLVSLVRNQHLGLPVYLARGVEPGVECGMCRWMGCCLTPSPMGGPVVICVPLGDRWGRWSLYRHPRPSMTCTSCKKQYLPTCSEWQPFCMAKACSHYSCETRCNAVKTNSLDKTTFHVKIDVHTQMTTTTIHFSIHPEVLVRLVIQGLDNWISQTYD